MSNVCASTGPRNGMLDLVSYRACIGKSLMHRVVFSLCIVILRANRARAWYSKTHQPPCQFCDPYGSCFSQRAGLCRAAALVRQESGREHRRSVNMATALRPAPERPSLLMSSPSNFAASSSVVSGARLDASACKRSRSTRMLYSAATLRANAIARHPALESPTLRGQIAAHRLGRC